MNRKQKIIVSVVGIFIVLLALVGITYGYFLTRIQGNTNTTSISVTTADLKLVYGDGNGDIIGKDKIIEPNSEVPIGEKTFTVTNYGNDIIDAYAVVLENFAVKYANSQTVNGKTVEAGEVTELINGEDGNPDMKLEITCTSYKNYGESNQEVSGTCNGMDGYLPEKSDILLTNSIDKNITHEYIAKLTYLDDGTDQSQDMNKTIEGRFNIIDTKDTVAVEGLVASFTKGDTVTINSEYKESVIYPDGTYRFIGVKPDIHTLRVVGSTTIELGKISILKGTSENVGTTTNNGTTIPEITITDNTSVIIANLDLNNTQINIDENIKNDLINLYDANELKLGDYVAYEYTPSSYITPEVSTGNSVYSTTQTFNSSKTGNVYIDRWRVLDVEKDSNNKITKVELVADVQALIDMEDPNNKNNSRLMLYGANGFKNGSRVLNEISETLYSGEYGTARSMNQDDLDKLMNYQRGPEAAYGYYIGTDGKYATELNGKNVLTEKMTIADLYSEASLDITSLNSSLNSIGLSANELLANYHMYGLTYKADYYSSDSYQTSYYVIGDNYDAYMECRNNGGTTEECSSNPGYRHTSKRLETIGSLEQLHSDTGIQYWIATGMHLVDLKKNQVKLRQGFVSNPAANNIVGYHSRHLWNNLEGDQTDVDTLYNVRPVIELKDNLLVNKYKKSIKVNCKDVEGTETCTTIDNVWILSK